MRNGVGAPNGPRSEPFDQWFRYPAGFDAGTLRACLGAVQAEKGTLIVDPFAGVGTAGIHAARVGAFFVGIEVHPLIAELAALKFQEVQSPVGLEERAAQLVESPAVAKTAEETILVRRSFTPFALERLVAIRESIRELADDPWQLHLKWCLLGALRDCASVKVGWPYQRPSVERVPRIASPDRAFLRRAQLMARDMDTLPRGANGKIQCGDSREHEVWATALEGKIAHGIISSPPYLNNFDYADATRLELYFWGLASSWGEMTSIVRSGMVAASTQQCRKQNAANAAELLTLACPATACQISERQEALRRERHRRPRGKEYDLLLPSYFSDLVKILVNMRRYTRPGARIALVLGDSAPYGIYVDTPQLLISAAQELGFTFRELKQIRQRGQRWHANGVRHSVALTEKLMILLSPGRH